MARRRDEFEGLDSAQEFTDDASAADLLSQYFGGMPADLPAAPEDTTALAQLRELVRMEEERRAAEAQATRPMGQDPVEAILPTGTSVNIAPPPATTGLPPGVTQADLDAIAAQFRQAGYQDTPPINFTGDPNRPFFDMGLPGGGVDPRYFVEGLTSPAINTVRTGTRGEDADPRCPPGMEYDYDARRCVRKEVVEPPRTTAPPVTTPPPTTEPPVTEPPATTPPPTTAPPVTTPPPTTAPPRSCPPGYIYNPETRQCEAFLTSPPPTTAPPATTPPPTTVPPTTAPPSPTPPPTTRPPVTCPPGYALNAQGRCAPIDLGPCEPGYVRSTITGRCEPTTTGTPPPATTAPPVTSAPPATTAPPTTTGPGCKQGEIFSTTLGRCVPITTEAPATTPPPATTTPPPGVITKFDPSAAMLEAYKRMFGTGVVNLGQSTPINTGTTTSPLVATTGVNTPTPGTATAGSPVPLPGFKNVTFTPGQPQFFGQTGGLLPGTVPSGYNPIGNYKGPLPGQMIAQNPNLSPTILGGLQGLGYYVDRLGNRIMSPGGGFMRFAEGGEANKEEAASQSAQAELRALLEAMPAETETEVSVSPTARSVRKTKKKAVDTGKAKGISMSLEESMASIEPSSRASAREQLAALMRRNRGLTAKTFSAPTLAARGPLATRRFQEGGEVDDSTPLQRRIYKESVSDPAKRTAPITEKSMSAKELDKLRKLIDIAERNPALSEKTGKPLPGVVDYAHQRMLMEQVDPMGSFPISMRDSDYNALESGNLRNTLGQFTFERLPDGTLVVKDTYDYTGDVGERFNPLIRYANKKGVNRPVKITLPPKAKKEK